MEKITLTLYKTANGFYVEHEADNVKNSYSVTCEADDWNALNPARANSFETPFKAPGENKSALEKPKIDELKAKVKELEDAEKELSALKEAAGGIDILQAIEAAKTAAGKAK